MQLRIFTLAVALVWVVFIPVAPAQNLKAQQRAQEEADKRRELLEEIQPMADRYAEAMVTRQYSDSLVQGYVSSLGQSLVPPDTPASTSFSFRVVQDIYPKATSLPDGRIYLTTGMLAHVENEAQLAMVLGHEIGHVIEEHALESLRRQRSGQRRNKIIGVAAGATLGGILGGKKGGRGAVSGAAGGAAAGALVTSLVNSVIRSRYSKQHEKEADRTGTKLALARGFDPKEAVRFWERQHQRFGKRSLSTKISHSLFGSHPRERVRAANLEALLAADLRSVIDNKRTEDGLTPGTPRFGNVISGLMRDTGTLMAERSDRHDLALRLLEKARQYRPNDPRLLWALGRIYRKVARTDEKMAEGNSLLATAADQDKRGIYPAVYRDIAYAIASHSEDYVAAADHLRKYVDGHITIHGRLPSDIDDVYDKMVLFGDNEWMPASPSQKAGSEQTMREYSKVDYHPTVWHTPANLAAYDLALQASTQQIEISFGGLVAGE